MKYKTEYLKSGGVFCPFCQSAYGIEGGPIQIEGGLAFQECSCSDCNASWEDHYKLSDAVAEDEPEETNGRQSNPVNLPSGKQTSIEVHSVMDVDATDLFADESEDWKYCVESAQFQHKEACEFMIYVGDIDDEDDEEFEDRLREMKAYGDGSDDLLALMRLARERHAAWLMLHA